MKTPYKFKIATSKNTVAVTSGNIEIELVEAGVLTRLGGVASSCVMIKNCLLLVLFLYF